MRRDRRWHGGRHATNRRDRPDRATPQHPGISASLPPVDAGQVDEQLLQALYDQHHDHLFEYALRLTGYDAELAKDIVEEALYQACQHPGTPDRLPNTVRPWLTVLTRRIFLAEQHAGADTAPTAPDVTLPSMASSTILNALRALSGVHRSVLVDLFYQGRSVKQIAAEQGVPVDTVKARLYYALRALRIVLQQLPE